MTRDPLLDPRHGDVIEGVGPTGIERGPGSAPKPEPNPAWWCPKHKGGVELGEEAWSPLVPTPESRALCPTCRPSVELDPFPDGGP